MSTEKAVDALSQCLPMLFAKNGGGLRHDSGGYRPMADAVDTALKERGFKIISIATYDRIMSQIEAVMRLRSEKKNNIRGAIHPDLGVAHGDRGGNKSDVLPTLLAGQGDTNT